MLTNRELQVLKLIAERSTNRDISCHLSISESTAENHIHHIYTKLRISNRAWLLHMLTVQLLHSKIKS